MKRIAAVAVGVLTVSVGVFAQEGRGAAPPPPPLQPGASQADVDKALLAAPANLQGQATVIKWKPDFTYDTLRKGTNRLVCYDRSGQPGQQPFSLECTSIANLDRVAQNLKFEAMGDKKTGDARCGGKGRNAGEARIRVDFLQPRRRRPGARSSAHDRRRARCHGAIDWTAR